MLKKMVDMTSLGEKPKGTVRLTDNYGNIYDSGVINNHGYNGSAGPLAYEYLVDGAYSKFRTVLYIPEGETSNGTSYLTIKADGIILYASETVDKTSTPIQIDVDITGVKDIIIEWSNNSGYNNISSLNCCLADPCFYIQWDEKYAENTSGDNFNQQIVPQTAMLTDITSIATSPKTTDRRTDNYGNQYTSAIINNHGYSGSAGPIDYEYLLNGKYNYFCGIIYVPEGESSNGISCLSVIGDGSVLYTSPDMTKTSEPVAISINISGYNDITIAWSNNSGYNNISSLNCCLAEACFTNNPVNQVPSSSSAGEKATSAKMITDMVSISDKTKKTDRRTDVYGTTYNYAIINTDF